MDLNKAIQYGQLVNAAYAVEPNDLTNRAGEIVSAGLGASKADFEVVTTMYANDLATQKNPNRAQNQVSIGLILQRPELRDPCYRLFAAGTSQVAMK